MHIRSYHGRLVNRDDLTICIEKKLSSGLKAQIGCKFSDRRCYPMEISQDTAEVALITSNLKTDLKKKIALRSQGEQSITDSGKVQPM